MPSGKEVFRMDENGNMQATGLTEHVEVGAIRSSRSRFDSADSLATDDSYFHDETDPTPCSAFDSVDPSPHNVCHRIRELKGDTFGGVGRRSLEELLAEERLNKQRSSGFGNEKQVIGKEVKGGGKENLPAIGAGIGYEVESESGNSDDNNRLELDAASHMRNLQRSQRDDELELARNNLSLTTTDGYVEKWVPAISPYTLNFMFPGFMRTSSNVIFSALWTCSASAAAHWPAEDYD